MKRGEKVVLVVIALVVVLSAFSSMLHVEEQHDRDIPFYSTATSEEASKAMDIYRSNVCKRCHTLWSLQSMLQSVPAPMLDGMGSLHTETWLYDYLSAPNPQQLLPSRLKKEYQMPSYASLSDADRHVLAKYLASLKVQDWYLEQTKKSEYEKLTGKDAPK